MKVYVVGDQLDYARWIDRCQLVNDIKDAQVVFFTGGGDVSPEHYGCKPHEMTWPSHYRDLEEIKMFNMVKPNQVVFGTCRGLNNCGSR